MLFYGWLEMKDQTDKGHWSVKMRYNTADVSRCNNGSFFQLQSSIFITILTRLQLAWESLITCITIISGFIIPLVNWLTLFRDKTSNYDACTVVPQQQKKHVSVFGALEVTQLRFCQAEETSTMHWGQATQTCQTARKQQEWSRDNLETL